LVTLGVLIPATQAGATNGLEVHRTNLVADRSGFGARLVDPDLTNAWGLASAPGGLLWVSDNNSGDASVYTGDVRGSVVTLQLTVAVPGGNPTGQVFNPTSNKSGSGQAFRLDGATGAVSQFIVSSDSIGVNQSPGEIAAWGGGANFTVEDSPTGGPGGTTPTGAVFKGLAVSTAPTAGPELFAADVANATVDVFNSDFAPVATPTEFRDPAIPSGYAPFGIQELDGDIYVSYAKQNAKKTNAVPGEGFGYIDVYSPDGTLLHHLINGGTGSPLDEPWGLAIAPKSFGALAGMLLVGNLGNGWINAFDPTTGAYIGPLTTGAGTPIVIHGLWGLEPGNASFGGKGSIIFSAGPTSYADGIVGKLTPR
jgi:uncharacterized protein (TIGR03118 family)